MSLAGQSIPVRESVHSTTRLDGVTSTTDQHQTQRASYRDSLPNAPRPPVYNDDAFNENETAKMYGDYYAEMTGPSPKKDQSAQQKPPALPAKSSLRASRLLDGMPLKIITNQPPQAAPQEIYLSSEEEASSSADEFSDYDYESESAESADSPVRKSHEDTARVVSVVYAGKPSIIDLPSTRRSATPESIDSQPLSRLDTSSTAPPLRRMSTSSTCAASSYSPVYYPPRSSSMMITSSMLPKEKPAFLSIDPYASKSFDERAEQQQQAEGERSERPRTPTSQLFKRTLSIVRKRSRPQLKEIAANNSSRDRLSSPSLGHLPLSANPDIKEESDKGPNSPWAAVSYHDIMRAARKNAQNAPPTPSTPVAPSPSSPAGNTRSRLLSGLTNRRKSMRVG
ncbi:uncharacterized protein ColSpa_01043 [Colletotrichum spaethianum]|uniref:Uncharacterized protein n=1 Tax=Colletotrichum spaethianum TaxID=700344 RepID=A0AA37L2V2_9PEZI|nr:uncharacterized protein ColSpa_01043 [Colletotrichum spaethianum]GKT40862.1 hypothetical protein ColSpa_01043 [Colletotrichum spaethianum]